MKVTIEKGSENFFTVAEMAQAKQIIKEMKDDENSVKDYAEMTARIISDTSNIHMFNADARVALNDRIYNCYNDYSGMLDIWLNFSFIADNATFYIAGAYLSDIWQYDGDNDAEIKSNMYIRRFEEVK